MARYVNVSTFATAHPLYDGSSMERAVDRTIKHWRTELDRVAPDQPDLIVLPENCDAYAGMDLEQIVAYNDAKGERILGFMQDYARAHRCYICYPGWRMMPDGTRRNSARLIDRDGEVLAIYDKNYPVIGEVTDCNIRSGAGPVVAETDFGRVCFAICFDLNFDALRLQTAALKPDLILFSSVYHGGLMQQYWAYSCRAHFVGSIANLPSAMISPDGRTLATTTNYFQYVTQRLNLDCRLAHLDFNWDRLAAMKAKYGAGATYTDPGHLAAVLVSSETDGVSVDDLVTEFGIELLDDYLARSITVVRDPAHIAPPTS